MNRVRRSGDAAGDRWPFAGRRSIHVVAILLVTAGALQAGGFSESTVWDDGFSEMCFYDATDTIYGTPRQYTRVHLMNRQWMDPLTGVKTDAETPGAIHAFKLVIAEQIPTENYNYRYLTTVFLRRSDLTPLKMTTSSQEWCGHTFKILRWAEGRLDVRSFSYFPGEGDRTFERPRDAVPFESLFIIAREAAATLRPQALEVLPSMRSNRQVVPDAAAATVVPSPETQRVATPLGPLDVRRVRVESAQTTAWFDVEAAAPHRIVAFEAGDESGQLVAMERRAYWDRRWASSVYPQGSAP